MGGFFDPADFPLRAAAIGEFQPREVGAAQDDREAVVEIVDDIASDGRKRSGVPGVD